MSREYPAVDVSWDSPRSEDVVERLIATLDDLGPTAIEEHDAGIRVFFSTVDARDRALTRTSSLEPRARVVAVSVPDEGWAERSQAALTPVRVGRIVVAPPWSRDAASDRQDILVVVQPSMGFGTGHHATTRLMLRLLQDQPLSGRSLLDVGTGSGVLALAAWRLGASRIVAIDYDEDAVTSARENLDLNGAGGQLDLASLDIAASPVPGRFDVVTANLTGAMLERHADWLADAVAADGQLLASGFQADEEDAVAEAFRQRGLTIHRRVEEDRWLAISSSPTRSTAR